MKKTAWSRAGQALLLTLALSVSSGCAMIQAQKLAGEGNRLNAKGELEPAIGKFEESLKVKNNDVARAGLAEAYLGLGRYADAQREAETAIKLAPTVREYYLVLARAQLLLGEGAKAFESANMVKEALAAMTSDPISKAKLKEALLFQARIIEATGTAADAEKLILDPQIKTKWPDDLDFRAELAVVRALQKNFGEAGQLADTVLKVKPTQGSALLAKGMVLTNQGKVPEAKALLESPLRQDHSRVMVFLQVARALREEKKLAEAAELLQLLSDIQPSNYLIHSELAIAYLDLKKPVESIREHIATLKTYPSLHLYVSQPDLAAFQKSIKDTPPSDRDRANLSGLYGNLAGLYQQQGEQDNMLDALERAAAASPTIDRYQPLANTYMRKGQNDKAVEALGKALELDPKNPDVLGAMAELYARLNKPEQSVEYYNRAVAVRPTDPTLRLNAGSMLFNTGHFKEAVSQFQELVKMEPKSADYWYRLGVAQYKAKDAAGARASLTKAIELKPDFVDAYKDLGVLAVERKDYKDAKRLYDLEMKYSKSKGK